MRHDMAADTIHPFVPVAQNVIMLTINVPNLPPIPETKLDLTENGFDFHAKAGDKAKGIPEKEYAFHLDFFAAIDPKVRVRDTLSPPC